MIARPAGPWLALLAAAIAGLATARPSRAQPEPQPEPEPQPQPQPQPDDPAAPAPPPPAEPIEAAPTPSVDELLDTFDDQNRVPENPALDILDAGSLDVVKPGAAKDVATELRALYAGGKIVPQIALELSPYALAYGHRTNYDDYVRRWWVPLVHRVSVSVATTNIGEGEAQATLGAIGLRVRLFDDSDWRLDKAAVRCAVEAAQLAKPPREPGTEVVVPVGGEVPKSEAKQVQACFDKGKRRRGTWNAAQLAVGAALSSAFPGGELQWDIRDLNAWIAWGRRLARNGHLVLAGKYVFGDTRKDGDVRIPARHTGAVAAQVERRSDRIGLLAHTGLGLRWTDDAIAMRWSRGWVGQLGGEVSVRATSTTWLALGVAALFVEDDDGSFVSLANFKWNFDVRPGKSK